jgi:CheY-like chemotaxis protein
MKKIRVCFMEDNNDASIRIQDALLSICLFEDSVSFADRIADILHVQEDDVENDDEYDNYENDIDLTVTKDFRDLAEWITEDPNRFDVIIMDLKVPSKVMRMLPSCKDYNDEFDHSSSLYFINHFLDEKLKKSENKIIFISAYLNELRAQGHATQIDKYVNIHKEHPDFVNVLRTKIKELILKQCNE